MSDFVQKANVKRSVRTLTTQIADIATLNTLVQRAIDTNAFQCVDHIPEMTDGRYSKEEARTNQVTGGGCSASATFPKLWKNKA